MTDAPELQPREIQGELTRLYQGPKPSSRTLVALYGTGKSDLVRADGAGEFEVVPVRSELELRERMPPLEDAEARLVFLLPWQGEVPLDLAGRFAGRGRIRRIDSTRRLIALCQAREAEDIGRLPLVRYLLRPGSSGRSYPVASGRVTEDALWCVWLSADWGLDTTGGLAPDTLLAWAATDGRGSRFVEAMGEPAAEGVRESLLAHLEKAVGAAGPVIWRAWERGRGRALLELALLCETLAGNESGAVRIWLTERWRPILEGTEALPSPELSRLLGETAPLAFRVLDRSLPAAERDAIVRSADARVDDAEIRAALIGNHRLPCAWSQRLDRIGALLEKAVATPSVEAVTEAASALKALESHVLFAESGSTRMVKRAEMAVKLLSWLVTRPDGKLEGSDAEYADAILLGRWYAEEGGFVDWARRWARGSTEGAVGRGAQAVAEWADRERAALDERFTRALQSWVQAGRPSSKVVPIDQALKRLAVPYLEQDPSRSLLVLLMDGMAWAQAVELLQSLGTRAHGWAPLAWHGIHRIGDGAYPAMFANLPTITEVSRSAFFAGKEMPKGTALNAQKDDERFRDNKTLHPFFEGSAGPRLLLRGEGHTGDGSASQEALTLIADAQRRVVGIVINAIDASLKGDTQEHHDWTVEHIRSLSDILEAAQQAGRRILLVSDHGHVPADRLRTRSSPAQAGARYRPWLGDADPVQAGELLFRGQGVYTPKNAEGVVLLGREDQRYGAAAHSGEHGGATLAEVVAPCVLIGWDDGGPESIADKALRPRPAHVPDWWHFVVRPPVEIPRTPVPPQVATKRAKGVSERQLGLPDIAPPLPPPAAPSPPPPARPAPLAAFAGSEMLKARAPTAERRTQVVAAVELLLSRGGALAAEVFAQHQGVLPFRVEGYVRSLQEVLNVDGYAVLRYDASARQVFLDRPKLEQQFEVKL
jgi:hypothetical protein